MRRLVAGAVAVAASFLSFPTVAAQDGDEPALRLASQTSVSAPGQGFDLFLLADEVTADTPVTVQVHRPVTSRSEFVNTLDGNLLRRAAVVEETTWGALPASGGGARRVTLLPERLAGLRTGVHPVTVRAGDEQLVTYLVRMPAVPAEFPLRVAWVQPVAAGPGLQPDGSRRLDAGDRSDVTRLADALAANRMAMTLDVTPETVESLATADDPAVDTLREALVGRQLLAAPYVDIDVAALVATNRPARLGEQRREGDAVLRTVLGRAGDLRTWSSDRPLSAAAVRGLRSLGVTRVVVPDAGLAPVESALTGGLTLAKPFALSGGGAARLDAVAVDEGLTAHFEAPDPVLGAHRLLADLAVLFLDAPGTERGVVVRPPATWTPSTRFLATALPALAASPIVEPVTVEGLFDAVPALTDDGEPVDRATQARPRALPARSLRAADDALAQIATLASADRAVVTTAEHLLAVAEGEDVDDRRAYIDAVTARAGQLTGGVRLLSGSTFRLTAREGTIPLTLVNDNPFPVTVDVALSSEKLEFADATADPRTRYVLQNVELPPGTRTVTVPVKARASAAFSLRATLLSQDGEEIGRTRYTVISTVVSGVGVVLSVGAGAFLLLWWASHWRTVRRARRLVPQPEPEQ